LAILGGSWRFLAILGGVLGVIAYDSPINCL